MADRDSSGRFVKGHGGGPGRPKKERDERFLEITLAAVTYDDWKGIVKQAVIQAKRGNKDARRFLADYLLGKPEQKHEIGGRDGGPIVLSWPDAVIDDS